MINTKGSSANDLILRRYTVVRTNQLIHMKRRIFLTRMILLSPLLSGCSLVFPNAPSDDSMIQKFAENEEDFNNLVKMFIADNKLTTIKYDYTSPQMGKNGITIERRESYRNFFRRLELSEGAQRFSNYGKENLLFGAFSSSLLNSGETKGYAYLKYSPTKVYDSLNSIPKDSQDNIPSFKKIKGNWYIYWIWR